MDRSSNQRNNIISVDVLRKYERAGGKIDGRLISNTQLFAGLRELYLHRNLLDYIEYEAFSHLESLEVLTLDNNRLFNYPGHFSLVNSPYLVEISLGANPWSCDCEHVTQFR